MTDKSSLTQSDFRKLLQTPRPTDSSLTPRVLGAGGLRPKPPATPRANPTSSDPFVKPLAPAKKKRPRKTSGDDEEEGDKESSKYRDRAAERRTGKAGEYTSTEVILSALNASRDKKEIDAKTLYEQSKFLGGDEEHTHLVKGLDFALLRKVRDQMLGEDEKEKEKSEKDIEVELEDALEGRTKDISAETNTQESTDEKLDITDPFIERIYRLSVIDTRANMLKNHPRRNELFLPGRMAFVFELSDETGSYNGDPFAIPKTIIRSKADVTAKSGTDAEREAEDENMLIVEKVARVFEAIRKGSKENGESERDKPKTKKKKEKEKEKEVKKKQVVVGIADDEDIFADVGRNYSLDIVDDNEEDFVQEGPAQSNIPRDNDGDVDMEASLIQQDHSISQAAGSSDMFPENDEEDLSQFMPPLNISAPTTAPLEDDEEDLSQFMPPPHAIGPTTAPLDEELSQFTAPPHLTGPTTAAPPSRQSYFVGLDVETEEDLQSEYQSREMKENVKNLLRQVTSRDVMRSSAPTFAPPKATILPAKRILEEDPDAADYNISGLGRSAGNTRIEAYDEAIDSGDEEDWGQYKDSVKVISSAGKSDEKGRKKGKKEMSGQKKFDRDWEKVSKAIEEKYGGDNSKGGSSGKTSKGGEGVKNRKERRAEMKGKGK